MRRAVAAASRVEERRAVEERRRAERARDARPAVARVGQRDERRTRPLDPARVLLPAVRRAEERAAGRGEDGRVDARRRRDGQLLQEVGEAASADRLLRRRPLLDDAADGVDDRGVGRALRCPTRRHPRSRPALRPAPVRAEEHVERDRDGPDLARDGVEHLVGGRAARVERRVQRREPRRARPRAFPAGPAGAAGPSSPPYWSVKNEV